MCIQTHALNISSKSCGHVAVLADSTNAREKTVLKDEENLHNN